MFVYPFMSSLFALSFFSLLFSFLCALPGTFATMGPAWPGTLAPERQVQGVWGAGSPPGNVEYYKLWAYAAAEKIWVQKK